MPRRRKSTGLTPDEALVAILEAVRTDAPLSLSKTVLLEMRRKVIALAGAGMGQELDELIVRVEPDPEYIEAVRLVAGYRGRNDFMCSLQRSLETHGGLTPKQANAVLTPPWDIDFERLEQAGIDPTSVRYHFHAVDLLDAHARQRRRKTEDVKAETT